MAATEGNTDTIDITLQVYDDDTAVALTVHPPTGTPFVATVTRDELTGKWVALVTYTMAGVWQMVWVITGVGAGSRVQKVAVGPASIGSDPRHTYANSAQLTHYLNEAPPLDADWRLRNASALVDEVLIGSVYDVDEDEMPTNTKIIKAMMEAVCETVRWWAEIGDDGTGATAMLASASISNVALGWNSGGKGTRAAAAARLGPSTMSILRVAGMLGHAPTTW
jgi:hypothetical protein